MSDFEASKSREGIEQFRPMLSCVMYLSKLSSLVSFRSDGVIIGMFSINAFAK